MENALHRIHVRVMKATPLIQRIKMSVYPSVKLYARMVSAQHRIHVLATWVMSNLLQTPIHAYLLVLQDVSMDTALLQISAHVTMVTLLTFIMAPFVGQYVLKGVSMVTALNLTNALVIWGIQNLLAMPLCVYLFVLEDVLMANVKHLIHVYVILASLRTQNIKINVYQCVKMSA
jgi:hypothetical protein